MHAFIGDVIIVSGQEQIMMNRQSPRSYCAVTFHTSPSNDGTLRFQTRDHVTPLTIRQLVTIAVTILTLSNAAQQHLHYAAASFILPNTRHLVAQLVVASGQAASL
ncbi:TPA: hypothetical protein ACH3X1_008439 [Trebouxia sp. C0004]